MMTPLANFGGWKLVLLFHCHLIVQMIAHLVLDKTIIIGLYDVVWKSSNDPEQIQRPQT